MKKYKEVDENIRAIDLFLVFAVGFIMSLFIAATSDAGEFHDTTGSIEARLPHNEGQFDGLGVLKGEVPRYFLSLGTNYRVSNSIDLSAALNSVVGQDWHNTVQNLGSGLDAIGNSSTYTDDLSAYTYLDTKMSLQMTPNVKIFTTFRNNIANSAVTNHFGVGIEKKW